MWVCWGGWHCERVQSRQVVGVAVGGVLWIVQVLTLPVEWFAVGATRAPYSLVDNTLSDLGAVNCGSVDYSGTAVEVCSPAHALFNVALFVGALLVAVGGVLVRPALHGRRSAGFATAGVVALVLGQLSGAATALVPIDVDLEAHLLVSTPAFVLQPVGLLLIGIAAQRSRWWWGTPMLVVGAVTLLVGSFFAVRLDPAGGGLLERLVLWPAVLILGLAGLGLLRTRTAAAGGRPPGRPAEGRQRTGTV